MPAPVIGDAAETLFRQGHHLIAPAFGRHHPACHEDDRLAGSPVAVEQRCAVHSVDKSGVWINPGMAAAAETAWLMMNLLSSIPGRSGVEAHHDPQGWRWSITSQVMISAFCHFCPWPAGRPPLY